MSATLKTMTFNNNNNNFTVRPSRQVHQIIPQVFLTNDWDFWGPDQLRLHGISHIININGSATVLNNNNNNTEGAVGFDIYQIDQTEFEVLELDFSFLTTVLPNCYRAVKFLDKALQNSGTVLFKEHDGVQSSLTLTIAYLMYKYKFNYEKSFQRLQHLTSYPEPITLDAYFIYQMYEYEKILEVQRSRTRGHSLSGELSRANMKRKYNQDSTICSLSDLNLNDAPPRATVTMDASSMDQMES